MSYPRMVKGMDSLISIIGAREEVVDGPHSRILSSSLMTLMMMTVTFCASIMV